MSVKSIMSCVFEIEIDVGTATVAMSQSPWEESEIVAS
jgi:hypothetical protein